MGERTKYDDGVFCWVELGTTDPGGAKEFYSGLLGWGYEDSPLPGGGSYTTAKVDGKSVAALMQQQEEARAQGAPPAWNNYVTVADADAAAAKAGELGGQVIVEPFDVMEHGRMAVIADPQGAIFSVWQPNAHPGAQLVNANGALTWNQLMTSDMAGGESFYPGLFGWEAETFQSDGMTICTWKLEGKEGGEENGGMMALPPGSPAPPHWLAIFVCEPLAEAPGKIEAAGGSVLAPIMDIPAGQFLVAQDPQGAAFGLFEGELAP